MAARNGSDGAGRKRAARRKSGRKTPVPGKRVTTRERIAGPLRKGAARARRLLGRLAGLKGAAARTLARLRRHEVRAGDLEALQSIVEALEKHSAAYDMPVDFSPLRRRLEALLSVLLEISDDRLAAAAARPLAEDLAGVLRRAEALFLLPGTLYRALDPARDDLASVREAAEAESFELARHALLAHLRAKEPPRALAAWLLECPERCLAEAELVARGFCRAGRLSACVRQHAQAGARASMFPRNRRDGAGGGSRLPDPAWRFVGTPFRWEDVHFASPHGHSETAALARAYAATGNEAFASEAVRRLLGWAAAAAAPPGGGVAGGKQDMNEPGPAPPPGAAAGERRRAERDARAGPAWEPALAAERLMSFGACILALRGSRAFTPETARVSLLLAHESAEHLARCPEGGAAARAGAALAVAGALFDEFAASDSWRGRARELLADAAAREVLPDGGDASLSVLVHERTLDSFVAGALAPDAASGAREAAGRMLAFERAVLMPGGELPGGHDPRAAAERLARLDLAASLLGTPPGRSPGPEFHAFEQSGFYVMRTGRGPDADCLLLRPAGAWGLRVACSGREVLAGPASPVAQDRWRPPGAPGPSPAIRAPGRLATRGAAQALAPRGRREALESARAATPDSTPPLSRALRGVPGSLDVREAEGPRSVVWRAGPPCDYVRVVSGLEGAPGATHRREVLFFERRFWALADRVRSDEDSGWALSLTLDSGPEHASPDGRRFVSGGLLVTLAGPTDAGFRFDPDGHGRTVARAESAGRDVGFVALLYPLGGEDPGSISVEPVAAAGGRVAGFVVRIDQDRSRLSAAPSPPPTADSLGRSARADGPSGYECIVAFPHGEGTELDAVPGAAQACLPPHRQAVALRRSGGVWRTVFEAE